MTQLYLRGSVFTDYNDDLAVSTGEAIAGLIISRQGASAASGTNGEYALEILSGI